MSKIPSHAKCVFKGVIFDVYQWEQELYDGTTRTFEALKRQDAVLILAMQRDQILYAYQEQPAKPPFISLFGGKVEKDETALEAAKRELLEETGLISDKWRLLRTYDHKGKVKHAVHFYLAQDCTKASEPSLDGGEKIAIRTCSVDEFINHIIPDPLFAERELKSEIFSALNPDAAAALKAEILG